MVRAERSSSLTHLDDLLTHHGPRVRRNGVEHYVVCTYMVLSAAERHSLGNLVVRLGVADHAARGSEEEEECWH